MTPATAIDAGVAMTQLALQMQPECSSSLLHLRALTEAGNPPSGSMREPGGWGRQKRNSAAAPGSRKDPALREIAQALQTVSLRLRMVGDPDHG